MPNEDSRPKGFRQLSSQFQEVTESSSRRLSSSTKRKILNDFSKAQKLTRIGNALIVEIPDESVTWLTTPDGTRVRKICGHRSPRGVCLLPAGFGTDHVGYAKCRRHSRSLMYNPVVSADHNYPTRLLELMQHVDSLEEKDMLDVDHEIKTLYALQQYIMTSPGSEQELSRPDIELLQELTMNIVKSKSIKNKIQREMRLDATSVKEFVSQVFNIIGKHVHGAELRNILTDIQNDVLVPFRNRDRIVGGDISIQDRIERTVEKTGDPL